MGEKIGRKRLQFNGSVRIEAREERLSSNGGALLMREYAERIGIIDWLEDRLDDPRRQDKITHPFRELLLTSLALKTQGFEDQDDADALRNDPAMRLSVSERKGDASLRSPPEDPTEPGGKARVPDGLSSQPTQSRLVRSLATEENRQVLREGVAEAAIRRVQTVRGHRYREVAVDVDDLPIEVHGHQPHAKFNPHYGKVIYRPLVASLGETGDLLDLRLREGTAHSTHEFAEMVPALLDRIEGKLCQNAWVRIDAGFQGEEQFKLLEDRGTHYIGRLRKNPVLDKLAEPFLKRPVGRPPEKPRTWLHEFEYKAEDWTRSRRAILVVKEPESGKLPIYESFWLVTSWTAEERSGEEALVRYRRRGSAEHHMGELMNVLVPRLSSMNRMKDHYRGEEIAAPYRLGHPFAQNEVNLLMSALGYNLMHGLRDLAERATGQGWSLQRLRERALLVATRILLHANQVLVVVGTSAAGLWRRLLDRLAKLRRPISSRLERKRDPVPALASAQLV